MNVNIDEEARDTEMEDYYQFPESDLDDGGLSIPNLRKRNMKISSEVMKSRG